MCYTYVLRSDRDKRFYTGAVRDFRARMKTGKGKRFLRNRLASFLSRSGTNKLKRD
jgi:predicted GIY-YIG superfamily endonuclease